MTYKGIPKRLSADFSTEIRREYHDIKCKRNKAEGNTGYKMKRNFSKEKKNKEKTYKK